MPDDVILMADGGGGERMMDLVKREILSRFAALDPSGELARMADAAYVDVTGPVAFTTDSYVVRPLEFPGGDIGRLAISGTVNDLACLGARPRALSLALILEDVALGVRDANYAQFDIRKVLERLLLKGSIVVKKAYCDWGRYKEFKPPMHEASFELIEIPHVRQSGKNSADIRMVVDALDLCYTKGHVDTFVIISGDSDFSPLVSKLRENNKAVIGVGVKKSTSDLLIANCDEFIYYDDLVRPQPPRGKARSPGTAAKPSSRSRSAKTAKAAPSTPATPSTPAAPSAQGPKPATAPAEPAAPPPAAGDKKREAWNLIVETYEALVEERGEGEKIWGSMIKQTLKRRKPGFSESYYGFRSFGQLLEEAEAQGILQLERDEKSGGFLIKSCHAS